MKIGPVPAAALFNADCFGSVASQGLSFHLGAVLISLGFITYVEHGEPNVLFSISLLREVA